MKKMLMILMMVVTMGAAFAGTFVAFTSEEAFDDYCDSDHVEWDAQLKDLFEESTADFSAKQKKNCSLIIVYGDNDDVIKNLIIVYHHIYDPKTYGVIVFDSNFNRILKRQIYATEKQDPVQIGLNCIKEDVTHVVNINKEKVVFAVEKDIKY